MMVPFRRATLTTLALLFCTACTLKRSTPADASGESRERQQVEAAMRGYTNALRTATPDSLTDWFTRDGVLLEPGMNALNGRAAILAFLTPLAGTATVQSAESTPEWFELHGTTAYLWGTYRQRVVVGTQPAAEYTGRYVGEWRRESDGQWRIARMMVQPFASRK